uniref:Arylsulfatase n=1 Tax=uncultured Armatimonadetes bacterium TaxID=157466 RepID=A0A6J4IMR7_9BACT|nr:Arylsulfatase [uncultured Armatimonadetes bacterium]
MLTRRDLMGAALGALLAARPGADRAAGADVPAASRPNLLFILADDLGYGDLGCYGQKRFETPNLDRLAREGMRFTQFYAGAPVCAPSRCVLLTGLHTGHATVRGNRGTTLLPEDLTVGEVLRTAGYRTAVIGKWGMGDAGSTGVPGRQGFERFFGYLNHGHAHNYFPDHLWRSEGAGSEAQRVPLPNVVPDATPSGAGVASERRAYSHDRFTEEALRFLDESAAAGTDDRPFFLYLGYTIPHANNEAGKRGMEVPDLGDYAGRDWPDNQKAQAAMIARMDRDVGRLLDRLKALGLDRNTLVLFSSDNGPHREGGNDPDFADSNGPLRGIKRDLYEGGIRVPFLARWPGRVPAGTVSRHVGHFADVLPTLAELGGAKTPGSLDGISVAPTLLGQERRQARHEHLYWEFYERGGARAVRMGDWKGVRPQWHAPPELYDLSKDPGEGRDVAAANPEVVAKIQAVMDRAHTPSPRWKVPPRPDAASPAPGRQSPPADSGPTPLR